MRLIDFFTHLFDTDDFPARWVCGSWSPAHGWLHICSDLLIFGAYAAIPLSLLYFVLKRRDVPFPAIFALFMAFILSCGITHLIEAIIFYQPIYRFAGMMKLVTAAVSWLTVFALIRTLPEALALPGVRAANEELRARIAERDEIDRKLAKARDELELRSSTLTLRDRRVKDAFDAASVCALQWDVNSGDIIWNVGVADCLSTATRRRDVKNWNEFLSSAALEELQDLAEDALQHDERIDGELLLHTADGSHRVIRLSAKLDPKVEGQPRTATGMFRVMNPSSP